MKELENNQKSAVVSVSNGFHFVLNGFYVYTVIFALKYINLLTFSDSVASVSSNLLKYRHWPLQ